MDGVSADPGRSRRLHWGPLALATGVSAVGCAMLMLLPPAALASALGEADHTPSQTTDDSAVGEVPGDEAPSGDGQREPGKKEPNKKDPPPEVPLPPARPSRPTSPSRSIRCRTTRASTSARPIPSRGPRRSPR